MECPTFLLVYRTNRAEVGVTHRFKAVDLHDAKEKAREFLRTIVLPTDRPGTSVRWAYMDCSGEKLWLIQELGIPI